MKSSSLVRSTSNSAYDWVNIVFLFVTPIIAVLGTAAWVWHNGVTWLEIANFFFFWLLTGIGITAGYHRHFSHRAYDCNKPLQLFYLLFGAAAVQNSALNWCSDHRYHHRFVDTEEDPYNILRGGLYAHILWIFYNDERDVHNRFKNIPDLLKNPLVVWQDRWYLALVVLVSFVLPTLVGFFDDGRYLGHLLWAGFLRIVIVHHMTFFINSLAHLVGSRPYSLVDTARDNWMLSPFTFGEGYHNFHHKFQADYRNGIKWYHFDMGKWWINAFHAIGWATRLSRTPEPLILKAKLEVDMQNVEKLLQQAQAPERMWQGVQYRLENGRKRFEQAYAQYQLAKVEYKARSDQWSADMRRQWEEKLSAYRAELDDARRRWQDLIKAMHRVPAPTARGLASFAFVVDILKHFKA